MKKVNPRKRPKTQADVDKAYDAGMMEGLKLFFDIALLTLADLGLNDEGLDAFNKRFNKMVECCLDGEMKPQDIRETLADEKGWEVQIV